ncbi:MAG: DUF4375 domain-containing protein [Clostridia bacterium]|nr:DUF4375 domain-containing protein [Clostridia bacterium]
MNKILIVIAIVAISIFILTACGFIPNKNVHGEDLLKLSDGRLYETVYLQNINLVETYDDEATALSQISDVQRTVYILNMFDMEIQNGGLCQFFVNSSRELAPYVDECLKTVGAEDQRVLFSEFAKVNQIDLNNLESFEISNVLEFQAQTQRYDFDSFDRAYMKLTPLKDYIVSYIKANINEF